MGLQILVLLGWLILQEVGLSNLDGLSWLILEEVGLGNLDGFTRPGTAELADSAGGRLK